MSQIVHHSAKPSHYNKEAEHYDALNEENSRQINELIEQALRKYGAKTVLDLTCGTGSQVFWLVRHGYEVVGSDINAHMLKIARSKARKAKLKVDFLQGDMRSTRVGQFDALITIFNAVGHLTKNDFETAIRNIHCNLKVGGLYIFDIFNLSYLIKDDNITNLTIDWQKADGDAKVREIQYSTIDDEGILASYTTSIVKKGSNKPKISTHAQTLQVYSAQQLKDMLHSNGFKVVTQCASNGTRLIEGKSERIITVARKRPNNT